jgi:AraC family transcriptional regulator
MALYIWRMTAQSERPSAEPAAPLLDVLTASAPAGQFESPQDDHHILDIHLGDPVPVSCRLDGRERPGLQTHGSFCVVPAGVTGQWNMSQPLHALLVRLSPSLVAEAGAALKLRASGAELVPSLHRRDPHVERIGWMLQAERDAGYPTGRLFSDSLAVALAARLLGLQSNSAIVSASRRALPRWRLRNVLDYIEAHLDKALSLSELAAVAGFSVSHFKTLFKEAVGLPVHRHVLERRIERARTLVLEGGRSMAEIALATGFTHQSHMARCMRRALGVSPTQLASLAR